MSNTYEAVIGLEIHVELSTKSKMFCTCSADYFGKPPNTHTCPTCLGLPGALPFINKQAIEDCAKIGLALGCSVSKSSRFERKNYFYPDLSKGYQISQYRWPLTLTGSIRVKNKQGDVREIRINRVHQEEDTGKLTHTKDATFIDYNRSGVPLVEVVTEPDFRDTEEIRDYAKKLQQICRYLGVSNADMERGDMRLEANVSVRKAGNTELPPYRVELKNINSFRFMVAAVEYEIHRQSEALEKGEKLIQETRGWDENKRQTYSQRVKEEANDYRYFPDPDLPVLHFSEDDIQKIKESMPELPEEKQTRFMEAYALTEAQAVVVTDTREYADYFEEAIKVGREHNFEPGKIANTLINKKFDREKVLPADFIKMLYEEGKRQSLSSEELEDTVVQSIEQNPHAVEDYKKGKENSVQFLVGQVMAKTRGAADPNEAARIIIEKLKAR